jgi:hypothetical protein
MRQLIPAVLVAVLAVGAAYGGAYQDYLGLRHITQDVTALSAGLTSKNLSGTIAEGGSFQQAADKNPDRKSIEFQNYSDTDTCYLYMAEQGTPAIGVNVLRIEPDGYYLRSIGAIPQGPVRLTCDSTGDAFYLVVQ